MDGTNTMPVQQPSKVMPMVIGILIGIVLGAGGYWWYQQAQPKTISVTSTSTTTSATAPATSSATVSGSTAPSSSAGSSGSTVDWISYSSTNGKFSFKYPKTWVLPSNASSCNPSILLLGANQQAVGSCNSENDGQMAIIFIPGDMRSVADLSANSYSNIVKEPVTVSGVMGQKETGTVTNSQAEGVPVGTNVTEYVFYTNGMTYAQGYSQLSGMPDVLNDFNTMVTKTLKFSP